MENIFDGKTAALRMKEHMKWAVWRYTERMKAPPALAVILVGEDPASAVYVRNKERACDLVGMHHSVIRLPVDATEEAVEHFVKHLNGDPFINGIIVQRPLPSGIRARYIANLIDPVKGVDGLHPANMELLAAGIPRFIPCTPRACLRVLGSWGIALSGKRVVVLGRSDIVGRPMANLALMHDATVVIAHSRTRDLPALTREADVLIVGIGKPEYVRGDWVKEGSTVIDVGINHVQEKLVGDVAFAEVVTRARFITPVPGGIGPLTVAHLLQNTIQAACTQNNITLT